MVHQERLEIGEKSFVGSTLAVLGLEASLTVITLGMHFSWVGLMLGVVGFCLVMVLANRIYAGSQQAQRLALGWIVFQAVYAGYALYLLGSSAQGVEMARQIGATGRLARGAQGFGLSFLGLGAGTDAYRAGLLRRETRRAATHGDYSYRTDSFAGTLNAA